MSLSNYIPIAEMLSKLLYPFAECVVHDVKENKIVAIFNNFSCRDVGDESCLENTEFPSDIIGPYSKHNYDGRTLKSMSVVLRDRANCEIGLLCVNVDVSVFDKCKAMLSGFLNMNAAVDENTDSDKLFQDDWYDKINTYIYRYCEEHQLPIEALTRTHKRSLVYALQAAGALEVKHATQYVAKALNMSRATVYNYLKQGESNAQFACI